MSVRPFPALRFKSVFWWIFWLLLIFMAYMATYSIAESIRGFNRGQISTIALLALLSGWFISTSTRRTWLDISIIHLTGFFVNLLIFSNAWSNIFRIFINLFQALAFNFSLMTTIPAVETFNILLAAENIWLFLGQLNNWMVGLLRGIALPDPIVINFIWGFAFWLTFSLSALMLRRKVHPLLALLPILSLLSGILAYSRRPTTGLLLFLVAFMALIVLVEQVKRELFWAANAIDFSDEVRMDVVTLAGPVVLLVIFIAGGIPAIPFDKIEQWINEQRQPQQEEISSTLPDALGLEQGQGPAGTGSGVSQGGMPRSHLIGSGSELSSLQVLTLKTNDAFPPPETGLRPQLPIYYLLGASYDVYTGKGWLTSTYSLETYQPNQQINPLPKEYYRLLYQSIDKKVNAGDRVYLAGQFVTLNTPSEVAWRKEADFFAASTPFDSYQGFSMIPIVSADQLRQDNASLPSWVLNTYLQLPEDLPKRIVDQALQIASDQTNTYDKALALQTYLRSFPYNLDLPTPPTDIDLVDYFLFDLQQGYCDYYASAMVVMSRSLGIPARLSIGYTSGSYDFNQQHFVVTEDNAHAWAELYFPSFGWIIFETTASLPAVGRQMQTNLDSVSPSDILVALELEPTPAEEKRLAILILSAAIFILFCMVALALWFRRYHKRSKPMMDKKITDQFRKLVKQSRSLDLELSPGITPLEFQRLLLETISNKAQSYPRVKLKTHFIEDLANLINVHVQIQYGNLKPAPLQILEAQQNGRRLRSMLWQYWIRLILAFI